MSPNLEQADFLNKLDETEVIETEDSSEKDGKVKKEETKQEEKLTDVKRRRRHIAEVEAKGTDIDDDRTAWEELSG